MKLKVVDSGCANDERPWYADGLKFTCSQCGNCCTGGPGYVWISQVEIVRLAEFLRVTPEQVVERYCRKVNGRFSLKENRTPQGNYDCVFLKEQPVPAAAAAREGEGGRVVQTRRVCSVYPVRPLQCRTWPFWSENLSSPERWEQSAKRCHGMNSGRRTFTREQMEALRDAKDWPENPPTSGET